MKKYLSYFLIACTVIAIQSFSKSNVSAKAVSERNNTSVSIVKNEEFPIPKLVSVEQISSTQIQIRYDRDVDLNLGTKATNYWVQDTMNISPKGIATLGKNESVNANNSLTDNLVKITPRNGSANTFILTFSKNIPRGQEYKLIICYVTVKGAPPYSGDNGSATFVGK